MERCEFDEDEDCGAEGEEAKLSEEDDYQAGFKYPDVKFVNPAGVGTRPGNWPEAKQKKLKLKYFKRRSKSKTSSENICVDDDGKTRKVGIISS